SLFPYTTLFRSRFLVEGLLGLNVQPEQRFRMQGPRLCQKIHAHEGLFLTAERVDIRELRRKVFFRGQVLLDVWILLARMAESFCRSSEVPGKNAFQSTAPGKDCGDFAFISFQQSPCAIEIISGQVAAEQNIANSLIVIRIQSDERLVVGDRL